jgi:hypothetical protein
LLLSILGGTKVAAASGAVLPAGLEGAAADAFFLSFSFFRWPLPSGPTASIPNMLSALFKERLPIISPPKSALEGLALGEVLALGVLAWLATRLSCM